FLKPGVNLWLESGAVLRCSSNPADFPRRRTRIEGHFEDSFNVALVNAEGCDGLTIRGEGTLDGAGEPIWDTFWRGVGHDPDFRNLDLDRARLCFIENCENVSIEGITFKDSQFWNLHLYNCRNVRVEKCRFEVPETYWKPPSTDGIDVDSCQDVTVRGCFFSITDDCVCLKGTKGPDALEDAGSPPVERVRISECEFHRGCGAVTCGSEATVVRDVVVENCRVNGIMPLARFKLRPDTPQHYSDIHFRNITMQAGEVIQIRGWSQYHDPKGKPEPQSSVHDIFLSDIRGAVYSFGEIMGNSMTDIHGLHLENIDLKARRAELRVSETIQDLSLRKVLINELPFGT
ncbi:MAG: right-handed parallel beta-helix repeat-containing protein, partial [Pontiellaceae bacterium]|nr:right-handed parallel beta-helix repeat-containing protein [Pontiellaceae bacterium]